MSLTHIRTAIDREQFTKGDVVIVKRTIVDASQPAGKQMKTICTKCGELFPTSFRRMGPLGSKRACEVRNVPVCVACRGSYRKAKKAEQVALAPGEFGVGDIVRCIEGGNYLDPLVEGQLYAVVEMDSKWKALGEPEFVQVAGYESAGPCRAARFVLVRRASEPKFKAGDKVRVVQTYGYLQGFGIENGSIVTVEKFESSNYGGFDHGPYVWLEETKKGYHGGSDPASFELVEAA
jgi:hypothetical protein